MAKKSAAYAKIKPLRNSKLKLFQKDGLTFGTVDDKNFIAVPDILLGAIALANGKHTLSDIAYHLVKNTKMPEGEMTAKLSLAFEIMEKNKLVSLRR
jgi:hypothetical protein